MISEWFGSDENNDEPFVVDDPWEWPDSAGRRNFDYHDDDDVVYEFLSEEESNSIYRGCRLKIRNWTYVTLVFTTDHDGPFGDDHNGAETTEVLYFHDEQVGGFKREYQFVEDGNGHARFDVEITPAGRYPDVLWVAKQDISRAFADVEGTIESYVKEGVV